MINCWNCNLILDEKNVLPRGFGASFYNGKQMGSHHKTHDCGLQVWSDISNPMIDSDIIGYQYTLNINSSKNRIELFANSKANESHILIFKNFYKIKDIKLEQYLSFKDLKDKSEKYILLI